MTIRRLFSALTAAVCCGPLYADSLEIVASVDRADIEEVGTPGRHRVLPDLTLRLSLSADCESGSGVLSVNVADTRHSYPMEASRVDELAVAFVVPASQLPPVPVPQNFCVAASHDPDRARVRAGLSVHASLRCTDDDTATETFASRSAAVDIPLSCRRRAPEDQDPAAGNSAARNSSARPQVSEASSGS